MNQFPSRAVLAALAFVASATSLAVAQTAAPQPAPSAAAGAPVSAGAAVQAATPAQPAAPAPGAKSIEAKSAMCIGCHGIRGYQASFPEVYKVPMIAGQSAEYIVSALNAYKAGDRKHPTMRAIATGLSDQDMKDLGAYYAAAGATGNPPAPSAPLPDKPAREPSPQVAALLNKAACVSCHGANFAKPIAPNYPKIAGQHADYLYVSLKAYQTDKNAVVGRNNAIMAGIAKQYTHAELKAMANYISSVDGDVRTQGHPRFRK